MVGDEMGLGKTIEMIAFLAALKESNLRGHVTRWAGPVIRTALQAAFSVCCSQRLKCVILCVLVLVSSGL